MPLRALFLASCVLCPAALRAQSGFAPLERWFAAVRSGDTAAIAAFYSTNPPATAHVPPGETQDPNEESAFWAGFAAKSSDLTAKLLEDDHSQPGTALIHLRIEYVQKASGQPYHLSVTQSWLAEPGGWRIVSTKRGDPELTPTRTLPEPARPNTNLYPPPEEARSEIDAALAQAAKDHKRVILVFGANWCYDCHVLNETFHSKEIAPLVDANYHVIHVNVGEEDKNLDLAAKYGVPLDKGIPALVVLDPDGGLVYSQRQGEFEDTSVIGPADVTAFLEKWRPAKAD